MHFVDPEGLVDKYLMFYADGNSVVSEVEKVVEPVDKSIKLEHTSIDKDNSAKAISNIFNVRDMTMKMLRLLKKK